MFNDWSWLLSVLISVSLLFQYYATFTFRGVLPQMDRRLRKKGEPDQRANQTYFMTLKRSLGDSRFVLGGFLFGSLNFLVGYCFGVRYEGLAGRVTIFSGFFVVGFIYGMGALGLYGILDTIKAFMRTENLEIDYSAPDGCGGTLFLGEALVKIGSVTLTLGVLSSIFIVYFDWLNSKEHLVKALMWFWIASPFAVSLSLMLAASAQINLMLSNYKVRQEAKLDDNLADLRARSCDQSLPTDDRENARKEYDYYNKLRAEVYKMRTWPFAVGSSLEYVGIFIGHAAAIAWSAIATMLSRS
jgi:hypothetical protein